MRNIAFVGREEAMDDKMAGSMEIAPFGWYEDPWDTYQFRYWDGARWTHVICSVYSGKRDVRFDQMRDALLFTTEKKFNNRQEWDPPTRFDTHGPTSKEESNKESYLKIKLPNKKTLIAAAFIILAIIGIIVIVNITSTTLSGGYVDQSDSTSVMIFDRKGNVIFDDGTAGTYTRNHNEVIVTANHGGAYTMLFILSNNGKSITYNGETFIKAPGRW